MCWAPVALAGALFAFQLRSARRLGVCRPLASAVVFVQRFRSPAPAGPAGPLPSPVPLATRTLDRRLPTRKSRPPRREDGAAFELLRRRCLPHNVVGLERLCNHGARGPPSLERLSALPEQRIGLIEPPVNSDTRA